MLARCLSTCGASTAWNDTAGRRTGTVVGVAVVGGAVVGAGVVATVVSTVVAGAVVETAAVVDGIGPAAVLVVGSADESPRSMLSLEHAATLASTVPIATTSRRWGVMPTPCVWATQLWMGTSPHPPSSNRVDHRPCPLLGRRAPTVMLS